MTLFVNYRAEAERVLDVPASCFRPVPKVVSSLVVMKPRETPPVHPRDEAFFFRVIRAAFGERRKTLANSLASKLGRPRAEIEAAIQEVGLDPRIRGERLGLPEFCALADALKSSSEVAEDVAEDHAR